MTSVVEGSLEIAYQFCFYLLVLPETTSEQEHRHLDKARRHQTRSGPRWRQPALRSEPLVLLV